jgi:hypothetical protein
VINVCREEERNEECRRKGEGGGVLGGINQKSPDKAVEDFVMG